MHVGLGLAAVRLPAGTDPAGDAGGCAGGGRYVREECAGDAGVLFVLIAGLGITKVLDLGAREIAGVIDLSGP